MPSCHMRRRSREQVTARRQRPLSTPCSAGVSTVQRSIVRSQRGSKAQPAICPSKARGHALDGAQVSARYCRRGAGSLRAGPRCRDGAALRTGRRSLGDLHDAAAIHHHHPVGTCPAMTPRSWVTRAMATAAFQRRAPGLPSRSRICACTVTSSAVVGSSAISSSTVRHSSAMAIITRWRMPPENSWGYICDPMRWRASGMLHDARAARPRGAKGGVPAHAADARFQHLRHLVDLMRDDTG